MSQVNLNNLSIYLYTYYQHFKYSFVIIRKKKYFGIDKYLQKSSYLQQKKRVKSMSSLETALSSINFLDEECVREELLPKLIPLLQTKKDITQQSLFNSYYQDFVFNEISYKDIIAFFEDMFKIQLIRAGRKKYLLCHWLYYQVFNIEPALNQEVVMLIMKQMLQKKEQAEKIIEDISKKLQFKKNIVIQLKSNIKKSSIYDQFVKFLTPSTELNPQKIEEKHKELLYIIQKMSSFGESVQYQLQKHIIVSFETAYKKFSNQGGQISKKLMEIKLLQELMIRQNRLNDKMKRKFSDLKMIKDEKDRYSILENIKSQLTIVDVFLLDYLISLSKKNSQENGKRAHQNIVLFVGPSGSGKTTIILRVLGYNLVQTEISQLSTLQPIDLRQEHSALRTSPESTSTTRYMFSAKIPKQSFRAGSYEDLSVCDSPGFEDSAGCEVDISNSISIQTFLKNCATVKLVVVISQRKVGDKMEGIREIAKIVSSLVVKYSEIEKDVAIVLNKFENQKEYARLRPGIQNILKCLTASEQSNTEYVAFLNSLLKRFKQKNPNLIRFDPKETDIQDFVQQLKEGKIMNPRDIFRYSLSTKSSHCLTNRKTVLTKLIKESLGKNNNQALYYLKQLILLSKCLNEQTDLEQEINNIKLLIRKQVMEKFKTFEKRIESQILSNDSNNNTFKELNKTKEQVKSFQIFGSIVDKLVTTNRLQQKINDVKARMLQDINKLSFGQQSIEQSKKKVVNIIKFLGKFQIKLQKTVLEKLAQSFAKNKSQLSQFLEKKHYDRIRSKTVILKNIFEVMQKGKEAITIDQNNPQIAIIDKKEFKSIAQVIKKQFQKMTQESTDFIQSYKQNQSHFEIKTESIEKINKNIQIFESIEADGPILNQIYARNYKNQIIINICAFGKTLIEQLNKIVDPNKVIDQSKIEFLKNNKSNTQKLKQINGVYGMIGDQIDRLWANFQRFISIQTKRLNEFLSDLKNEKKINRKTLRNFKSMIDRIIKFSQGDNELVGSINQLKMEIKKSIGEHIKNLKNKIDKVKITLKLKRTLDIQELKKFFEKFVEIEAFYRTKQFNQQNYLEVNNSLTSKIIFDFTTEQNLSQSLQSSSRSSGKKSIKKNDEDQNDDDQYEDIDIKRLIKQMYATTLQKLLNPFNEITTQTKKTKEKGIKNITSNYLQMLNDFMHYKYILFENEIHLNKDLESKINKFEEDIFAKKIKEIIEELKDYFDEIYKKSIEQADSQSQIYKLQTAKIKEFKKLCTILLAIKKNSYLEELFLQSQFGCQQYIQKTMEILNKSQQLINTQLANRKQTNIDYIERLLYLKKQIEEMKPFDQFQFEKDNNCTIFEFGKIYTKITTQLNSIQGKQSNAITNLFKDQTIILSDVRKMYVHLQSDVKNEDNLTLISNGIQTYGEKLIKNLLSSKEQYKNDETMSLDNQNANNYLVKLQKMYKFYEELKQFVNPKFFQIFTINQSFFVSQIGALQIQERIKSTYEAVKDKLQAFEYKTKPRQFQKIVSLIKKAQLIVEKITKDTVYSQLYRIIEKQETNVKDFQGNKFSERLKYFMSRNINQSKVVFSNENNEQVFLQIPNFINMYNNSPQQEKQIIDAKMQTLMQEKLQIYQKTYDKSQEQRKNVEEIIRKTVDKLPNKIRKQFRDRFDNIKNRLRQKQENQVRNIKKQLNTGSNNVFQSVIKFQECKNQNVQKELKNIIGTQLKTLVKEITVLGNNKKMVIVQSFKKYLRYFGAQNLQMIEMTKNNEKIKDSFLTEQRAFLINLIYEQKELIRSIDNELVRCSMQSYQNFNRRCRQMNELYVLAVEDDYQGMCTGQRNQIVTLWLQFIKKINNKIQEFISMPQINIIIEPASKIQKIIIQLKFIRNFIKNFLEYSNKISHKKNQFIQQTNKKFQKTTIDNDITKGIAMQINERLNELKQINFYDQQIRILNFASLQVEFQKKLINSLKLLEQYQDIYNQYLCQREQDKFYKKDLIEAIQGKWQENMNNAKEEFQSAISYPQEQISQKILIIHKLTQIITNRKWDIIDKQLKSKEQLQSFLDSKFNQIKAWFTNDLTTIGQNIKEKENIYQRYQEIKLNSNLQIGQIQRKCNQRKQELEKIINQTVDQDAKQKLTLQNQNIQSLKIQKIQSIKDENYNVFVQQKERNEQSLKIFIHTNVVKHLIIMKKVIQSVHWKAKENQSKFIQFLQNINKQSKTINKIIFQGLNASNNSIALMIAAESDIFKSQAALQFKNLTSKQGIQYILASCPQLKADKQLNQDVYNFYHMYQEEYDKIIKNFQKNPDKQQINIVAKQLRDLKDKNQNRVIRRDNVHPAIIMARVFSTWSMSKVDLSDKENISIDFQPHPAQIVAIYLLIGLNDSQVKNSLIEVLTGEGKSIVLAGLCIYLALKGYRPYCACYSQYLSSRDEKEFKELFEILGISSKIKYGTFNQHCQQIINESSTSLYVKAENIKTFRQHMKSVIMNKMQKSTTEYFAKIFDQRLHKNSKKILIIDEADVFFNENFFGRLYCPSLSLDDEQTKQLIAYIWSVTKPSRQDDNLEKIQLQQIYESHQFKKVATKYPAIQDLIKNQVIGMLQAVYNYHHGYIIHQDSIKYRDNDSITDKISYGYKTVFANCFEYQRKAISQISYNSALKITLNIAPFSYSQLPTFFQAILGVSGTVSSMSDYKRQMLRQRYGIEETYEIPSIYGATQRMKDNFTIARDEVFYDKIVQNTKKVSQTGRPIAIFFKTIKDVTNFYKSPQFSQLKKNTTILTEQTDHESRQTIIKRVGQRGKITILTESFARGTDFKIFDKSINDIGGLHVIQTFISSDLSEYIQTRGRTARQGSKGSFQVLINQTQLQKFQIICNQNSQFQQKMKSAWTKKDSDQCVELGERVDKAREKHLQTQNLFRKRPTQADIISFIYSHNKFNQIRKNNVRTLIGIDGTASMGLALKKVFGILEDSFTRTKTVLQKKKVAGSFQNQIGIYRNYDSDFERLLQFSGFEADSQKLKEFLQNIQVNGGWGNEAMQVLFQHANKIKKLDQVIIIADARANGVEQTKKKRARSGQNYWVSNGFPITYQTEQVLKLKQKKIKIHTLYINLDSSNQQKKAQLKKYCQNISKQTGGASQQLKLKDINVSQALTGFLVKNILMLIGGQEKGRELAASYDQDFAVPLRL